MHSPYYLLSGENISARFIVPTVAASIDLVVHLGVDVNGVRRVNEIVGVPGRVENDIIETESVFERSGGELRRSNGTAPRPELYERVGIDVHHILNVYRIGDWVSEEAPVVGILVTMAAGYTSQATASRCWP